MIYSLRELIKRGQPEAPVRRYLRLFKACGTSRIVAVWIGGAWQRLR